MKSMKVTHWNAGSKHFKNKLVEIQDFLASRKPDILFISEANVFSSNLDEELVTPGYKMH